jgi:hypothetical protein
MAHGADEGYVKWCVIVLRTFIVAAWRFIDFACACGHATLRYATNSKRPRAAWEDIWV